MLTIKQHNITFNPDGWKVKITERTKGRMKLQVKLNQEETGSFRNFANSVKPDDFVRSIFFAGIRDLEEKLTENLVQHMEANKEQYEASGFTFDDEGKLTGTVDEQGENVEVIE